MYSMCRIASDTLYGGYEFRNCAAHFVVVEGKEEYCGYNFRTNKKREEYERTGVLPKGTPKIYNQKVVEYLVENMN